MQSSLKNRVRTASGSNRFEQELAGRKESYGVSEGCTMIRSPRLAVLTCLSHRRDSIDHHPGHGRNDLAFVRMILSEHDQHKLRAVR